MSSNLSQEVTLTINDVLSRLQERVSFYDARLILDAAVVLSGVPRDLVTPLNRDEAKNLCMELINRGGPAFHVGAAIYKEMLQ